jgi:hypothetical protein
MYSSRREVQQPRCRFAYLPEADLELAVSRDSSQSRKTSTVVDEALRPVVPGGSRDISCPEPVLSIVFLVRLVVFKGQTSSYSDFEDIN